MRSGSAGLRASHGRTGAGAFAGRACTGRDKPFLIIVGTHSGAAVAGPRRQGVSILSLRGDARGHAGSRSPAGEMLQAEPSMGSACAVGRKAVDPADQARLCD